MNTLPLQFSRHGYTLRQVERSGPSAIYEQSRDGKVMAYEAVLVRVAPAQVIMGTEYPKREVYPSSEAWGVSGWTCLSVADAQRRLATEANPGQQ